MTSVLPPAGEGGGIGAGGGYVDVVSVFIFGFFYGFGGCHWRWGLVVFADIVVWCEISCFVGCFSGFVLCLVRVSVFPPCSRGMGV